MPDIRYVFLSDLHFGAENSVLTDLVVGRPEVDPASAGATLRLLVECLRSLVSANERWEHPTLVLGGDVLELALAEDHIAAMVFERFTELALAHTERIFDDTVYFVPGNHDHHLWEAARERHYADYVAAIPKGETIGPAWHATRLLATRDDAPVSAALLTAIVRRDEQLADVQVHTVYPNFGIVDSTGTRAVVFHHGHYAESLYRLVSTATEMMFGRPPPQEVWEWESENFAWVDFFWSTLGRSGTAGRDVNLVYDSLQSPRATEHIVDNLTKGLTHRLDRHTVARLSKPVEELVRFVVDRYAHHVVARERRHADHVLREATEHGLREYVEGPVRRQLIGECNGELPEWVTFVFGHTHKPFASARDYAGFHQPVGVANTGGWVVDTLEAMPLHGGAAVLVDEDLNAVLLTLYTQHDRDDDYRVTVQPVPGPGDGAARFAARLLERIADDEEPFREFSAAAARAVRARRRDLRMIVERADALVEVAEAPVAPSAPPAPSVERPAGDPVTPPG